MRARFLAMTGCLLLAACLQAHARQEQESLPAAVEEQLEHSAGATEDDTRWQQLHNYTRHKIPLNSADEPTLQSLGMLTPLQISSFLAYRRLLGPLASIYELQAVPGFEPSLIRRLLPYVTVGDDLRPHYKLGDYMQQGGHSLLMRYGRQLEKARGYSKRDTLPPHYAGTPDQLLLRYRYHFSRYASWGVVMEKDAGEQFFKGAQRQGFDFYSAHLFIRNYGKIKALALGDFMVNMGQGLINRQSLTFNKSPLVMQIKREGEILQPYTSAGEYYFFRGAGVTLQQGRWQMTGFLSLRNLDGIAASEDSLLEEDGTPASLYSSGYHRSVAEAAKRRAIQQFTAGGNVQYEKENWRMGVNVIQHRFSSFVRQGDTSARRLLNAGLDYSGSWKNIHAFGETAVGGNGKLATVNGLLVSVAPKADLALLYRYYDKAYQALYSNAFGDHYRPVNESGLYTAVTLRPTPQLKWEGYADVFRFPWLKYRSNAPGGGRALLMTLTYTPDKGTEAFLRYSARTATENSAGKDDYIAALVPVVKRSWRCQVTIPAGRGLKLRSRLDWNSYQKAGERQQGWMCYQELQCRSIKLPLQVTGRLTWFSTGGTNSSVYAVESGLLYSYGVARLYGNGWQYNINIKYDIRRRFSLWLRWNQVIYSGTAATGSGWDQTEGRQKTTIQLQLQHEWRGKQDKQKVPSPPAR